MFQPFNYSPTHAFDYTRNSGDSLSKMDSNWMHRMEWNGKEFIRRMKSTNCSRWKVNGLLAVCVWNSNAILQWFCLQWRFMVIVLIVIFQMCTTQPYSSVEEYGYGFFAIIITSFPCWWLGVEEIRHLPSLITVLHCVSWTEFDPSQRKSILRK